MPYQKYMKAVLYTVVLSAIAISASCSLKPVSAIQIIASPEISLPLGSKTFPVHEYLSPEELEKRLNQETEDSAFPDKKVRVYNYIPSGEASDNLRYLIHYPLETMNFELGNNFDNTDLTKDIETSFSIPKIEKEESLNIPLAKINDSLLEAFNQSSQEVSIPLPDIPQQLLPQEQELPFDITFNGFETLTFGDSGSAITFTTQADGNADYDIVNASMNGDLGTVNNRTVTFDLNGKEIKSKTKIIFTVRLNSGSGKIKVKPQLQGTIKKATGINETIDNIELADGSVDIPLPEGFQHAEIKSGSLQLSLTQPSGWKNIGIKHKTKLTQAGSNGLFITSDTFEAFNTPVLLAGKKLNDEPTVNYSTTVQAVLKDATYTADFDDIPVTLNFNVTEFKTITLENRQDFEQSQAIDVPAEMKKWIKTIKFNKISAEVTMNNGLPEGNDLKIKLKSDVFKIDDTGAFRAGKKDSHSYDGDPLLLDMSATEKFDVTATLFLPGYNDDKTFTLKNIKTGTDINLTGKVAFNLDWEEITINAQYETADSFPKKEGKFIDLSNMTKILKKAKLNLHDIPMYFYAGFPLLKEKSAKISLSAEYKNLDEADTEPTKRMQFLTGYDFTLRSLNPGLFSTVKDGVFTGKISEAEAALVLKRDTQGENKTLSDLLNAYPAEFKLHYALNTPELLITRDEYNALKDRDGKVEMRVDIILDLTAAFTVTEENTELSLEDLAEDMLHDGDIFGRTEKTASSLTDTVLASIRSLELKASFKNTSGLEPVFIIRAKDKGGNAIIRDKIIALKDGKPQPITFSAEDWKKIAETVPFSPELLLKLDSGNYSIKREAELNVTLTAVSKTEIDYTIKL